MEYKFLSTTAKLIIQSLAEKWNRNKHNIITLMDTCPFCWDTRGCGSCKVDFHICHLYGHAGYIDTIKREVGDEMLVNELPRHLYLGMIHLFENFLKVETKV